MHAQTHGSYGCQYKTCMGSSWSLLEWGGTTHRWEQCLNGRGTTHRWEKEGDTTYATTGIGLDGVC